MKDRSTYYFDGSWYARTTHGAIGPFTTKERAIQAREATNAMDQYADETRTTLRIYRADRQLPSERVDSIFGNRYDAAHACELYAKQLNIDVLAIEEDTNVVIYRAKAPSK